MTPLISKVQYKRSEKGEFHNIAQRSLDDTILLVLNYPWDIERSLATIQLSCPSVTIEHPIGSYLKIGPYFSGKFSLYFLDINNKVYLKVVDTLEETCGWIKLYFEQQGKLQGFEKYGFTINPSSHFQTNFFEYTIDTKAIVAFFKFPVYMVPLVLLLFWLKYLERPEGFNLIGILFILLFFLFISSPLIYFFFNYLSVDKNHYIQISKGHDEFVFGPIDNKKIYNKQDIAEINAYGVRNSRSLWSECEVFTITFKNGEQIRFTSLLISGDKVRQKFADYQIIDNKRFFPTIKSV